METIYRLKIACKGKNFTIHPIEAGSGLAQSYLSNVGAYYIDA